MGSGLVGMVGDAKKEYLTWLGEHESLINEQNSQQLALLARA